MPLCVTILQVSQDLAAWQETCTYYVMCVTIYRRGNVVLIFFFLIFDKKKIALSLKYKLYCQYRLC